MMHVPVVRRAAVPAVLLSTFLLSPWSGARADDTAAPGVLWENSSQVSMEPMEGMEGMPPMQMPATKTTRCTPAVWTQPPATGEQDRGCVTSDFLREDNKVTWTSVCEGPPAMTGQAEIVFDGEGAYSGSLRYASEEGTIVIALSGTRIGDCDNPQ
jgi:Protein of unknown function (DUF3617)